MRPLSDDNESRPIRVSEDYSLTTLATGAFPIPAAIFMPAVDSGYEFSTPARRALWGGSVVFACAERLLGGFVGHGLFGDFLVKIDALGNEFLIFRVALNQATDGLNVLENVSEVIDLEGFQGFTPVDFFLHEQRTRQALFIEALEKYLDYACIISFV